MSLLMSLALAATCQNYQVSCVCSPAVPFEGYQIVVVEKCDGQEDWHPQYGQQQFTTKEECEQAIPSDQICKQL